MVTRFITSLVLIGALAAGPVPFSGGGEAPQLRVQPSTAGVGEQVEVTASGLGDVTSVTFGMDATAGATYTDVTSERSTAVDLPVTDGRAVATFTATEPGEYSVSVGTGQSTLGTATITVTAATASAAPGATSPSPTPSESSPPPADTAEAPADAAAGLVYVFVGLAAVVAVAVLVTVAVVIGRGRRGRGRRGRR